MNHIKQILLGVLIFVVLVVGYQLTRNTTTDDSSVEDEKQQQVVEELSVAPTEELASEPGDAPDAFEAEDLRVTVPEFTLPSLSGGTIDLASYRGEKPVVLVFWASWCHNCQRNMPVLSEIYQKYDGQVEVIGVNIEESPKTAQQFVDKHGISFPIALDTSGDVSSEYFIRFTNTHVLIDMEGYLVQQFPGDATEQHIQELL